MFKKRTDLQRLEISHPAAIIMQKGGKDETKLDAFDQADSAREIW